MTAPAGRLLAGQIGKPHGLAGDVYVVRISDDPSRFTPGARLLHEDGRELVVEAARAHRSRFLVRFAGIADRTSAEGLRGAVYVSADDARPLEEDEYWERDLAGAEVVDTAGTRIGVVAGVEAGAAQDRLVVDTERGERLVPLVREIVVTVDVDHRRVVIEPPEGLLD